MKKKIKSVILITILLFCTAVYSQTNKQQKMDTIKWYHVILSEGTRNGGKVYSANEVIIDSVRYAFLFKYGGTIRKCRPCYLLELNEKDEVITEGNCYLNTPIGIYKEYYANGKLKVSGHYKNVYPLTHDDFKMGMPCIGKCTVKEGEWKYYSDKGKLTKTEKYKEGKLLK